MRDKIQERSNNAGKDLNGNEAETAVNLNLLLSVINDMNKLSDKLTKFNHEIKEKNTELSILAKSEEES